MAKIVKKVQDTVKGLMDKMKESSKKSDIKKSVTNKTKAITSRLSGTKEKKGKSLSSKKSLLQREPTTRKKKESRLKSKSKSKK